MTTKTYIGDTGTVVELDTGVSLAGATALTIEAAKPDGTTASWTGSASGTSIAFTSLAGTFDVAGPWHLQGQGVALRPRPARGSGCPSQSVQSRASAGAAPCCPAPRC